MLTYDRLHEILRYDPETGKFFWKINPSNSKKRLAGKETGKPDVTGYCHVRFERKLYKAHRLAWLYMTGEWPKGDIDHRDLNPGNNRWDNLRDATKSQNLANCKVRKHSVSGIKGVRRMPTIKESWLAEIRVNKKKKHIGCFPTKEQAAEAYWNYANKVFGEFANSG